MQLTFISLLNISSMSFVNVAPNCVTISTIADSLPATFPGAIALFATVVETVRNIICLLTLNFNLKLKKNVWNNLIDQRKIGDFVLRKFHGNI